MKKAVAVLAAVARAAAYGLLHELPARRLNDRAGNLRKRYADSGNLAYLDQAIVLIEKATNLVESGSPNKAIYLTNLGRAFRSRYQATLRLEDIDQAIRCLQEALARTSVNSPDRAPRLDSLTRARNDRAEASRRS